MTRIHFTHTHTHIHLNIKIGAQIKRKLYCFVSKAKLRSYLDRNGYTCIYHRMILGRTILCIHCGKMQLSYCIRKQLANGEQTEQTTFYFKKRRKKYIYAYKHKFERLRVCVCVCKSRRFAENQTKSTFDFHKEERPRKGEREAIR